MKITQKSSIVVDTAAIKDSSKQCRASWAIPLRFWGAPDKQLADECLTGMLAEDDGMCAADGIYHDW